MKLSDLDYPLPKEKIALFPTEDRPAAKLLCVDRTSGACSHRIFRDLPELLKPTDLLVLNNTKVLPARLFGKRVTGGKVEALLLKDHGNNVWEALLKPGGRIKDGERIVLSGTAQFNTGSRLPVSTPGVEGGELVGTVMTSVVPNSGKRRIQFEGEDIACKIHMLGHIPLPPYIDRPDQPADRETYQTVFAKEEGAVAAPTAGLHFDRPLLEKLTRMGVEIVDLTLHVSYGTFQPITEENIEKHKMFEEEFEISEEAARKINAAKRAGRRVIVCGTTCVRALESAVTLSHCVSVTGHTHAVCQGAGKTSIFIYPPYDFKIVDGLITNFHMPKSTLLAMAAAFLSYPPTQGHSTDPAEALAKAGENEYNGLRKLMAAYNIALKESYRFASYGDAMLIS